jgi:fluoride exporter
VPWLTRLRRRDPVLLLLLLAGAVMAGGYIIDDFIARTLSSPAAAAMAEEGPRTARRNHHRHHRGHDGPDRGQSGRAGRERVKALMASLQVPALVFLGAGFGGLLRFWIGGLVQHWYGPTFPIGTLVVNISGCLAIGFLAAAISGPVLLRDDFRALLFVGVLGGYTTFSSFGRESLALIADAQWTRVGLYIVLTNVLGLGGVWLGAVAGRWAAVELR